MHTASAMRRLLVLLPLSIFPLLFSLNAETAMAASGNSVIATSTGATSTGVLLTLYLKNLLSSLIDHPALTAPILATAKETGWQSDLAVYKTHSLDWRTQCQDAIRRANRDEIMQKATTCLRGDLMQEISFLRKESAYVTALPGVTPVVASGAIMHIVSLIDADTTVVNAIDAHLYSQIDALKDVKQKLTVQYRTPEWLDMLKVRADVNLTWINFMSLRLNDILQEGTGTALIEDSALTAVTCLDQTRQALQNILANTDLAKAGSGYALAISSLATCRENLWTVAHLKERQETVQNGSGTTIPSGH